MTKPPTDDFSRYELMVLHRLTELEADTKSAHLAFEDLRVEIVGIKKDLTYHVKEQNQKTKAHTARVALAISSVVAIISAVAPYIF